VRLPPALRKLAVEVDTRQFARTLRALCWFGAGMAVLSEIAAYILPGFPRDMLATVVFGGTAIAGAWLARPTARRRWLSGIAAAVFAVLGWYLARAVGDSGGFSSPHQGAVYLTVLTVHALLPFSVTGD